MNRIAALLVITICGTTLYRVAAQEKGNWRAAGNTAKHITGDITFAGQKIAINFSAFTVAQIHDLQPVETAALFPGQSATNGSGSLYRTSIPAAKTFLHHNTLCGSEDTQWIATYVSGRDLQLAFFSGSQMPVFTPDALANTTNLCGTFAYVR